ncbi:MAG TPA: DUF4157 domain-containing protein [Pyrinomonadaceae bacterium]|nr:DUF4157 domain-containing protein [Pyrinomonadaceae bacterium]
MQRRPADHQASGQVTPTASVVDEGLQSSAHSLDANTRRSMESHFGQTFEHVRVHNDATAANSARQVDALAYTVGNDIIFGANQYKPDTDEGRHLLAHELTHTIQQSNGVAFDKIRMTEDGDPLEQEAEAVARGVVSGASVSPRSTGGLKIARQQTQPGTTPAQQPAAAQPPVAQPAAPQGWDGCTDTSSLPGELSNAVSWVKEAIDDLEAKELPRHTSNALSRYLTTDSGDLTATVVPKLKLILAELQLGATNFACQTQEQCTKVIGKSHVAGYSGHPITLCDSYFDGGNLDRITLLIHEAGHNANLGGDIYEFLWPFPGLDKKTRLQNADSFAAFVRNNKYPSVAPFVHGVGLSLGVGGLFPGGCVSPRYVVRTEYDTVLKQRIFRFMDLHLNMGLDVDSAGSVLNTFSLGARSFAPLSLTKTPFFLDLRAGPVFGELKSAGSQFRVATDFLQGNVRGLSTEVSLGISSGRLGGSVSYRHIFNFMYNNPDLDALVVSGEIRFF